MIRNTIAAVLLLIAASVYAQSEITPGLALIRGGLTPGQQPDGNSIVLRVPSGLIVIDSGRHAEHTQRILDYATSTGLPIVAVVNTHWHLDHIAGNPRIRKAYPQARVYASGALEDARKGFLARYRAQLEEMIGQSPDGEQKAAFRAEIERIDAGPALAPDIVIDKSGPLTLGGRDLDIGLERHAVTAGDVWLYDKRAGVLVSGDLVTLPAPFLDTACPQRWKAALDRLAAIDFDLLIPGHGPALTHRQFDQYRNAFAHLLTCTSSTAGKDVCIRGWLEDVGSLIPSAEHEFTKTLMSYYVDVLRRDAKDLAPLCGDE